MRRSAALQGVRVMRFLDILGRYEAAEFNQMEAAELLGVDERTFRRWRQRFEDDGEAGLLDRRLGKASGKRVPVDRADEVEALYRERYRGFTAKHFHEHLVARHNFSWGYTWTKTFLHSKGLLEKAKRRGAHRRKRPRRPMPGLTMSLYTDRGAHYFLTPEAGGKVDRSHLTQVGRALEQLGVEHIGAYSPQARGRSERAFQTLQDRLVKEL